MGHGLCISPVFPLPRPPWNPLNLFDNGESGLWLDSRDVAAGAGNIASWPSRAGGWAAPVQAVAAEQPRKGGAAWTDGAPTVQTQAYRWLRYTPPVNPLAPGSGYSLIWIGTHTVSTYGTAFSSDGATAEQYLYLDAVPYKLSSEQTSDAGATVTAAGPTWTKGSRTMAAWHVSSATQGRFSLNGSAWSAPSTWFPAGTLTANNPCGLLAWTAGNGGIFGLTRAVVIVSRALTDRELALLDGYYPRA